MFFACTHENKQKLYFIFVFFSQGFHAMSEESLDDDIPLTIDESVGVDHDDDDDDDDDADEEEEEETPIAAPSPLKQK